VFEDGVRDGNPIEDCAFTRCFPTTIDIKLALVVMRQLRSKFQEVRHLSEIRSVLRLHGDYKNVLVRAAFAPA